MSRDIQWCIEHGSRLIIAISLNQLLVNRNKSRILDTDINGNVYFHHFIIILLI